MDLREAAGTLGVHYQTAYGWVRQGVLPARKVGRGYELGPPPSWHRTCPADPRPELGRPGARPVLGDRCG